jgi:DNA-binding transcriptional regulator YiaG
MSTQGFEFKAARERAHLTQQDVAEKVGVSLRTVGNWERGESIPRSRMAALVDVLGLDDPRDEMVSHLGRLVRSERGRLGYKSAERAADAAGIKNYKTLAQFELGKTMPNSTNRALIEELLMWQDGALTDALSKTTEEVTLDTLRDWEKEEPASAASELTDDDLIVEVIKRMGVWRLKLAAAEQITGGAIEPGSERVAGGTVGGGKSASGGVDFGKRTPAERVHQSAYDLAAHTPRGGKKVDPRKATRK